MHLSVTERPITVMLATNLLYFMVRIIKPFPCIRFYTDISMTFIYVWHYTLFGSMLA